MKLCTINFNRLLTYLNFLNFPSWKNFHFQKNRFVFCCFFVNELRNFLSDVTKVHSDMAKRRNTPWLFWHQLLKYEMKLFFTQVPECRHGELWGNFRNGESLFFGGDFENRKAPVALKIGFEICGSRELRWRRRRGQTRGKEGLRF